MKDYWGQIARAYHIGFHDGGKSDVASRYFDDPDYYEKLGNNASVLPQFRGVEDEDAEDKEEVHPQDVQVYLDNYLWSFVNNVLYEAACKLIDQIADQLIEEDNDEDGDLEEEAPRYELCSKKKSDRNNMTREDASNVAPDPLSANV